MYTINTWYQVEVHTTRYTLVPKDRYVGREREKEIRGTRKRQGARHDETRQDETRQDKTRQDETGRQKRAVQPAASSIQQ